MDWYILQSLSGQEKRVAAAITERAEKEGLSQYVEQVIVPIEKVQEVKKGKKVDAERKFLPGYILVRMEMRDDLWHMITSIAKVGKFLGIRGQPQRVSEKEVQNILGQIESRVLARRQEAMFDVGDEVVVNEGPFESFTGVVEDIDEEKQRMKVSVTIFGRATPLDLEFKQVSKKQ